MLTVLGRIIPLAVLRQCLALVAACAVQSVALADPPPPGNDECGVNSALYTIAPPTALNTAVNVVGTLESAAREVGTSHTCPSFQNGVDVFYYVVPTFSGAYRLDTCTNTGIDTVLSVHSGACPVTISNQLPDGCNDDACSDQSRVVVWMNAGTMYTIRVGAYRDTTDLGEFQLFLTALPSPANDDCSPGNPVVKVDVPFVGTTIGATTTIALPAASCGQFTGSGGGNDVFLRLQTPPLGTVPASAMYTLSLCGSSFDTVLSVHSTCPPSTSNLLACNDDASPACSGNIRASRLSVQLDAGKIFVVRVGGYRPSAAPSVPFTGTYTLNVTVQLPLGACCNSGICTQTTAPGCGSGSFSVATTCASSTCDVLGACCSPSGGCSVLTALDCQTLGNVYLGDLSTCDPGVCPQPEGACCRGATCSQKTAAACTGPNTRWTGPQDSCNSSSSFTHPCCFADFDQGGTIEVSDIFSFLAAWFAGDFSASVQDNGAGPPLVPSIFTFLSAWFAGCP